MSLSDIMLNNVGTFRCTITGDSASGKTSLLAQYGFSTFSDYSKAVIGVEYIIKRIQTHTSEFNLEIWDKVW
jgi:GTPase SAR1 family protein